MTGRKIGSLIEVDLISSKFGECGIHFVRQRLVSVFVDAELVCKYAQITLDNRNKKLYLALLIFAG